MARPKKEVEETVDLEPTELQDNAAPKAKGKPNANNVWEQWKVGVTKDHETGELTFEKQKLIKEAKIPDTMAERLNANSVNSKIRYYKS